MKFYFLLSVYLYIIILHNFLPHKMHGTHKRFLKRERERGDEKNI